MAVSDLLELSKILPDRIKLGTENVELKKQIITLKEQFQQVISQYQELKRKYQLLEEQNSQDKVKIKKLKQKISDLKKQNNNSIIYKNKKGSLSTNFLVLNEGVKDLNSSSTTKISNSENKKNKPPPTKHSSNENQHITNNNEKIDNNITDEENDANKYDIIDDFHEFDEILNELESEEASKSTQNNIATSNKATNKKANSKKEEKKQRTKKEKILPQPSLLPDLIKEIKNSDLEKLDGIVDRVLTEKFSSLSAAKKRYAEIINTLAISIRNDRSNSNTITSLITFFIKFSNRISPNSITAFANTIKSDKNLLSLFHSIEVTIDLNC